MVTKGSPGSSVMGRHEESLELMLPGVPHPHGDYPHARRNGDLVFFSGVGPRFPQPQDGRTYPERFELQCQRVLDNAKTSIQGIESSAMLHLEPIQVEVYLLDLNHSDFVVRAFQAQLGDVSPDVKQVAGLPGGIQIEAKVLAGAVGSPLKNEAERARDFGVLSMGPSEDDREAPSSFRDQFELVFERLSGRLALRGAGMESVLDVTMFLRRLTTDWDEYNRLYRGRFNSPRPARTTLGVSGLPANHNLVLRAVVGFPTNAAQ